MHKIGILSDTHNLLRPSVADILRTCEIILHAGDLHTRKLFDELAAIAPIYAVRGNADKEWAAFLPRSLSTELFGVRIFMIHDKKQIQEDISDKDLIICGHSHKYEQRTKNSQIWLNPGSCGHRRFALPVTMAVLTVSQNGIFQIEQIRPETDETAAHPVPAQKDMKQIVICVMRLTEKGKSVAEISRRLKISSELAEQICRLYVTHPGVTADGILGKMEL